MDRTSCCRHFHISVLLATLPRPVLILCVRCSKNNASFLFSQTCCDGRERAQVMALCVLKPPLRSLSPSHSTDRARGTHSWLMPASHGEQAEIFCRHASTHVNSSCESSGVLFQAIAIHWKTIY